MKKTLTTILAVLITLPLFAAKPVYLTSGFFIARLRRAQGPASG